MRGIDSFCHTPSNETVRIRLLLRKINGVELGRGCREPTSPIPRAVISSQIPSAMLACSWLTSFMK